MALPIFSQEIVPYVMNQLGIQPRYLHDILGKSRCRCYVIYRYQIARYLRDEGLSLPKIGSIMKRDHSSIHYLLKSFPKK